MMGFDYVNENTIRDTEFGIHLTKKGNNLIISQFLIRRLDNGYKSFDPDQVFFSEGYPQEQKDKNDISVIIEFIDHLKLK